MATGNKRPAIKTDLNKLKQNNWDTSKLTSTDAQVIKQQLRGLGRQLKDKIQRLKLDHASLTLESDVIARASRRINDVERKSGFYVSSSTTL